MKKKILIIGLIILVIVIGSIIYINKQNNKNKNFPEMGGTMGGPSPREMDKGMEVTAEYEAKKDEIIDGNTFEASDKNKVAIAIKDNAKVNLSNITVNKTGDTDDIMNSDMSGINSAIFIGDSRTQLSNGKITANAKGANGIYIKGNNANLELSDTIIETIGERARGIDVLDKGKLTANNIKVKTTGDKSSGVATDRGSGYITIDNSEIITNGNDSAGIYSTGNIKVSNTKIIAKQAEGAVIESDNSIELENVEMEANKKRGIMLMSSVPSYAAGNPRAYFKMYNSKLTVKEGPVFYVTNTNAMIDLSNTEINCTSGIFLQAKKDETEELEQEGRLRETKGGIAEINCTNQKINGDIILDENSEMVLNLTENSGFVGKINTKNTAKKVELVIDNTSVLNLTGDCYIDNITVENYKNIKTNGYNIYFKNSEQELTNLQLDGGGKFIKK